MYFDQSLLDASRGAAAPHHDAHANLRRYGRAPLVLFGACSLSDAMSFPCHTRDLSAGGVAVWAPVRAEIGARADVRLERLGPLRGEVVRAYAGGFAIELDIAPAKRDRLAEQIAWMAGRSPIGVIEDYRHARDGPLRAVPLLVGGEPRVAEVIDVSRNGVALRTFDDLPRGLCLTVGRTQGRVLHRFAGGVAIEFVAPVGRLPSGAIDF